MFRKLSLALAAATLVASAAIPTAASAHSTGWRHYHRGGVVVRVAPAHYAYGPRCFTKKRWVKTRWGGWRVKHVRVCR